MFPLLQSRLKLGPVHHWSQFQCLDFVGLAVFFSDFWSSIHWFNLWKKKVAEAFGGRATLIGTSLLDAISWATESSRAIPFNAHGSPWNNYLSSTPHKSLKTKVKPQIDFSPLLKSHSDWIVFAVGRIPVACFLNPHLCSSKINTPVGEIPILGGEPSTHLFAEIPKLCCLKATMLRNILRVLLGRFLAGCPTGARA